MSHTIAQTLAAAQLDPVDARALLRHALGVDEAYLIAHSAQVLSDAQSEYFAALAARRGAGEPVAYIVGRREFFSLEFEVTPAVLIPRPDTELLVEVALDKTAVDCGDRILELGTGSGCIAISIAKQRPHARVVAVDSSAAALAVARANARRHAVTNVEVVQSDWFDALAGQRFYLIVANPPYVAAGDPHLKQGDLRFEPAAALVGGADGLDCIRQIVASAPQYLSLGGWLAFEHGYDQSERSRLLLADAGYDEIFSITDLADIERVSGGRRRAES
jgi:release factor glutamine methyltransferase